MRRSDKAPHDAEHDHHADDVSSPDVQTEGLAFGKIGDQEADNEGPVKRADKDIPNKLRSCLFGGVQHQIFPQDDMSCHTR